ncbi:hypothetical protein [Clostridium botulinum]|uniref:hypothetical protein n=1 Tax=Clostridium botulinum TaxID=1491 RepID=UPI001E369277|nr:hypothetical protein [Clostridium botulinum]MCD3223982.1 hypothetical protein [Clostridium botulinum C/D]MCD3298203.1 hypothetical protein [Clostridium botulinum C/D]
MKFNSEIIKKAHQMANEIKKEYADVDYKTQFGLCLSYLLSNKKGGNGMDIKLMETTKLLELKEQIEQELKERNPKKEKVIYKHECFGRSNYHQNKYKHWIKKLDAIDDSKTNGYAFVGNFLNVDTENLIEVNNYVVEVCGRTLTLYKVVKNANEGNKEFILEGNYNNIISFIKECKEIINL